MFLSLQSKCCTIFSVLVSLAYRGFFLHHQWAAYLKRALPATVSSGGCPLQKLKERKLSRRLHLHPAISDFRQNPFKGAFKHSVIQGTNRTLAQLPYVIPPTVIGALA